MDTGTKISGIAHIALIGAALFGGAFRSDPLPFETQDVAVISAQEFEALLAAQQAPDAAPQPAAPSAPEQAETPDIATPAPEPAVNTPAPEPTAEPAPETLPDTLPAPLPPQVTPDTAQVAPALPTPAPDADPDPLVSTPRPRPRPVDRIAPQPVAAPPPDTRADDTPRPDTAPDPEAETPQPEQDASAPEEATDRIDPEATEDAALAPTASLRPPASRPRPRASQQDAVEAALREAAQSAPDNEAANQAETRSETAVAPSGPPLTAGERADLIVAVGRCWNTGALSTEAARTTVVVGVQMTEAATPVASSIRLLSYSGGSAEAAQNAFQVARRAIIRCGASGFDLPKEKYDHWRDIEMTFNPEKMNR